MRGTEVVGNIDARARERVGRADRRSRISYLRRFEWAITIAIALALLLVYAGLPFAAAWTEREAQRGWADLYHAPDDLPRLRPPQRTNDSARMLLTLTNPPAPAPGTQHVLSRHMSLDQIRRGGTLEPLPALVAKYLEAHERALATLVDRVLRSPPVWGWRFGSGGAEPDDERARPFWLLEVLGALALTELQRGDLSRARPTLEALALVGRDGSPGGEFSAHHGTSIALARGLHLPLPPALEARLAGDAREELIDLALSHDYRALSAWRSRRRDDRILHGLFLDTLFHRPLDQLELVQGMREADSARVWIAVLRNADLCAALDGHVPAPAAAWWAAEVYHTSPSRLAELALDRELTRLVLRAKAEREELGRWPARIDGLQSQACPSVAWTYEARPDDTAIVRFGRSLPQGARPSYALRASH